MNGLANCENPFDISEKLQFQNYFGCNYFCAEYKTVSFHQVAHYLKSPISFERLIVWTTHKTTMTIKDGKFVSFNDRKSAPNVLPITIGTLAGPNPVPVAVPPHLRAPSTLNRNSFGVMVISPVAPETLIPVPAGMPPLPPFPKVVAGQNQSMVNYNVPDCRGTKVFVTVELKGEIQISDYRHMMRNVTAQIGSIVARHNIWHKETMRKKIQSNTKNASK